MTLILGVDQAQNSGFAWYETDRSVSAIEAGVLKADGESIVRKATNLGRQFFILLRQRRPDLIAFEAPILTAPAARRTVKFMGEEQQVQGVQGLNAVISSNDILSAMATAADIKAIPWVIIPSPTWRKAFLGFARQPGWQRKDWKKAVREACARERITVTNDDMADAVGIAIAARNTPEFKQIQYEQSRRAAA